MDEFRFVKTAAGRSFLGVTGSKTLLLDVEEMGRIWARPTAEGGTSIALRSGSCEVVNVDTSALITAFLGFLNE